MYYFLLHNSTLFAVLLIVYEIIRFFLFTSLGSRARRRRTNWFLDCALAAINRYWSSITTRFPRSRKKKKKKTRVTKDKK